MTRYRNQVLSDVGSDVERANSNSRWDAKLLQVLVRQARENRLVYVILADRLRSQTTTSVNGART